MPQEDSKWSHVDQTSNPKWYVSYLESSRKRLLAPMGKTPESFFGFLELGPRERLLDVGCGTGDLTRLMKGLVGEKSRVIGIDYSRTMIEEACKRSAASGDGIEFAQADAEGIPYPGHSFTRTTAQFLFQHLPHPEKALREMVRVTRHRGLVGVLEQDWGSRIVSAGDLGSSVELARALMPPVKNPTIARELPELFHRVGLSTVKWECETYLMPSATNPDLVPILGGYLRDARKEHRLTKEQSGRALRSVRAHLRSQSWVDVVLHFRVTGRVS